MWRSRIAFRARPIRARGRCDRLSRVPTRGDRRPLAQAAGENRRSGNPRRNALVHMDFGASLKDRKSAGDGRIRGTERSGCWGSNYERSLNHLLNRWGYRECHQPGTPDHGATAVTRTPLPRDQAMRKYFVFGVIFSSAVILEPFGASRAALAGEGPGSCDADIDNSGTIDGADLSIVLSAWGPCAAGAKCPSDLTGDGLVDGADLATLLANWGACEPRLGCDIETTWSTEFLIHGLSNTVWSTTIFDDGSGPALYAGGQFLFAAGGTQVNGVARWSGLHWTPLGDGVANGSVLAMAVHDDGSGPSLYVGGSFSQAGGIPTGGIARWDGQQWHPVGSGIAPGTVRAMTSTVIDGVPTLCVAVNTTSGGITSGSVIVWRVDRSGWTTIGSAMNGEIRALAVYGDSDSTYLYAGGSFSGTEQQSLLGIARVPLPLAGDWELVDGGINEGG